MLCFWKILAAVQNAEFRSQSTDAATCRLPHASRASYLHLPNSTFGSVYPSHERLQLRNLMNMLPSSRHVGTMCGSTPPAIYGPSPAEISKLGTVTSHHAILPAAPPERQINFASRSPRATRFDFLFFLFPFLLVCARFILCAWSALTNITMLWIVLTLALAATGALADRFPATDNTRWRTNGTITTTSVTGCDVEYTQSLILQEGAEAFFTFTGALPAPAPAALCRHLI